MWQLVHKKRFGFYCGWIPKPWPDRECKVWFCPLWPCTVANRQEGQTRKAWSPPFHWERFYTFRRKNRRLLYRGSPCDDEHFRHKGSSCLCDGARQGRRLQTPVLQHRISRAATDFLRMAGKSTLKPDREFLDGIYPFVLILIQMEHGSGLLRA